MKDMNPLLNILFISLTCLMLCACNNESRYRRHKDGKSLYAVLYKYVSNGDSLEDVEKLLGEGEQISIETAKRMFPMRQKLASTDPDKFPDGVSESDMLIGYTVGKQHKIVLTFRDGKLVNYVQDKFEEFVPLQ